MGHGIMKNNKEGGVHPVLQSHSTTPYQPHTTPPKAPTPSPPRCPSPKPLAPPPCPPLQPRCFLFARKFAPSAQPWLVVLSRDCETGTAIHHTCLPGGAAAADGSPAA